MTRRINNVSDVVSWRLCLGCGACASVCPEQALTLVDVEDDGLRPRRAPAKCVDCGSCLSVCPGIAIDAPTAQSDTISDLSLAWGNVLEVWEGYAGDEAIRFLGSSGGVATALSLFWCERMGGEGVLHIGPEADRPLVNAPMLSRSRDELAARTGSRYAPAAPCAGLNFLKPGVGQYAFVGKPCDVVAVRKCQSAGIETARAIGLTMSIFCAGTPSTRGTKMLLDSLSVAPEAVAQLRYRGCGWPGQAQVCLIGQSDDGPSMSYEDSWGTILSKHTQFRCRLCPDATGELADVSCGDPWYRDIKPGDPGRSLVLVRTEAGRQVLRGAMDAGYVQLEKADPQTLPASQPSLLNRRRQLWGRLLAMRLCHMPTPTYRGFSLWANWRSFPLSRGLRSSAGMLESKRLQ